MLARYKDLVTRKYPPDQIILLKDLFELLEKLIDRTNGGSFSSSSGVTVDALCSSSWQSYSLR